MRKNNGVKTHGQPIEAGGRGWVIDALGAVGLPEFREFVGQTTFYHGRMLKSKASDAAIGHRQGNDRILTSGAG